MILHRYTTLHVKSEWINAMSTAVRIIAQHYNKETGGILEERQIRDDDVAKPDYLKDLGYLHMEQMDLIAKCQEFKISHQIKLVNHTKICPICKSKAVKLGVYSSEFHAMYSDHTVTIQRLKCKGGCNLPYKLEGLFGSSTHPELLKKQAELTAEKSYVKASRELNYDAIKDRAINNRTHLSRVTKIVSSHIESLRTKTITVKDQGVKDLISMIDGGHVKYRGEGRSFEAMIASVYRPECIETVDKNHQSITNKRIVSSSKDDKQESIKKQYLNACVEQGMGKNTHVTCLADGADNCWSVTDSIKQQGVTVLEILDWFHIGKKFKNIQSAVSEEQLPYYDKAKWHLWHGNPSAAITKLENLIEQTINAKSINKLVTLKNYISNNKSKVIDYGERERLGQVYASSYAESTVNNLINVRQKNKQRMTWTREGSHQVLQIRSSKLSEKWEQDWKKVEDIIYLKAA